MQITLEIEITGNVTAIFSGEGSEQIVNLFNSNRIPTPFTFAGVTEVEHHGANIIRQIRALNADATVAWSTQRCEQFVAFKSGAGR